MSESPLLDLIIKNVRVVCPHKDTVELLDLGIKDGKFAQIAPNISSDKSQEIFDAQNLLGFPGVVDAHMHIGIYQPLDKDAVTESKAAAMGGVTTSLNYIRTGQYYLNKGGSYRDFFPEVLALSLGNFFVDYSYHIAPIASQHIEEIPLLFEQYGISSFKIFMFYGGYGLHGLSDQQNLFLMINKEERYDFAHFEFIMRGLTRLIEAHPEARDIISLSLHCEVAEILNAYTKIVENDSSLSGLKAYSAARPPHSEGLAICIASYLAHETNCANINLLHLSSRKAMEAALTMQTAFPHINFRREVTVGHLLLDVDTPNGTWAKVNPPIRPRADVEYLWQAVLNHQVDWIVSDHACCSAEQKRSAKDPHNIWLAKSGFGGTEYLLSGVISEGSKRGMSYNHIAKLLSWNPSQRFGLLEKGDIAIGYDADLVLVDPNESFVVHAAESESQQGYTPFEGVELTGRVKSTFLRGNLIYNNGQVLGSPTGRYLKRSHSEIQAKADV
ncbi:amidohydrolase family protein [Nostocaceae cyanobacterium CENA357]|uniref:Amidohydrolase family protein n=1 Tax=Atlanticothrix silvestris CENA357 TaxID=1725252 RepID=A0A8J7L3L3_9CYAN|nr:amidohydrolase family protein [Atlanticothrix silvestris]MBH8552707.1 amidohydrolase family protein [Atlanticothrix silvestris CENA357]